MNVRVLTRSDLRQLMTMRECLDLMRHAFALVSDGKVEQPIRTALRLPNGKGVLGMMPGNIAEPACFGIKVVSVYPGNHGTAYGSHQGAMLLFDDATGALSAIIDGRDITAVRTAAASAVATDLLARPDARSMAIYGYGEEAETHLEALLLVRPFERVVVCGRSLHKARAFAEAASARTGMAIEATDDSEAASTCDVLTTVTAADEPFLAGKWLRPGTHLNVVGSSIPSTAEVDDEAVLRSRLFTDYTASALALGGEIRRAIGRKVIDETHILGCVGDVATGKVAGRVTAQDITMFKSLGMAAEDPVTADYLLAKAQAQGVGTLVPW